MERSEMGCNFLPEDESMENRSQNDTPVSSSITPYGRDLTANSKILRSLFLLLGGLLFSRVA